MPALALTAVSLGAAASAGAVLVSSVRSEPRPGDRAERPQEVPARCLENEPPPEEEAKLAENTAVQVHQANGESIVEVDQRLDQAFREVSCLSKAVMYIVSNKTNDKFSPINLSKYLRMKEVDVFEGPSEQQALEVNARKLLEYLQRPSVVAKGKNVGLRHVLIAEALPREEIKALLPAVEAAYAQQPLDYGRNSRYGDKWRISCYLVVLEKWKPKIEPHMPMVECMSPTMHRVNELFAKWYCQLKGLASIDVKAMNAFVTRYRPVEHEDQLEKHIDGANVDGSVILALGTNDPFDGGDLRVWDGKPTEEFVYSMQPGDVLFLDHAVWHQGCPITRGTRWALVLFLRLENPVVHGTASRP